MKEGLLVVHDSINNELRILQVTASDIAGGAARAAYRLHNALIEQGRKSTMFVASKCSGDPSVELYQGSTALVARLRRISRRMVIKGQLLRYYAGDRPPIFEIFTDDRSMHGLSIVEKIPPSDIINLHWVANFIDYRPFFKYIASSSAKTVWTLHDMNPFTGGCHYNFDCSKFINQCGACPQLGSDRSNDLSRKIWKRKFAAFSNIDPRTLHIVTPSHWLAKEAQSSSLLSKFPVSVIPNGINIDSFKPLDRSFGRNALGIPENSRVILFVADTVANQRKGFSFLLQSLELIKYVPNVFLVSVGKDVPGINLNVPKLHLGELSNDRLLSLTYSCADVFVIPSVQDNLPNTILESFACGTPVIGFSIGGIPDLVLPGVTGDLARPFDVGDLASKIGNLLMDNRLLAHMGENCRKAAVENYSLPVQADNYINLYNKVCDN